MSLTGVRHTVKYIVNAAKFAARSLIRHNANPTASKRKLLLQGIVNLLTAVNVWAQWSAPSVLAASAVSSNYAMLSCSGSIQVTLTTLAPSLLTRKVWNSMSGGAHHKKHRGIGKAHGDEHE